MNASLAHSKGSPIRSIPIHKFSTPPSKVNRKYVYSRNLYPKTSPIHAKFGGTKIDLKEEARRCNCKRSNCLKLYCNCFSFGDYCRDCNCIECENKPNNNLREEAIQSILSKNPNAFNPKVISSSPIQGDEFTSAKHTKVN